MAVTVGGPAADDDSFLSNTSKELAVTLSHSGKLSESVDVSPQPRHIEAADPKEQGDKVKKREMLMGRTVTGNALWIITFSLLLILSYVNAADEVHALLEFRKGIKEDPLQRVVGTWNETSVSTEADVDACPSSFYGVECDASTNSVVSIILEGLGLSGELKFFTLIGLKMLKKLSLSGNHFTGRLVPALGSMTTLQHLDLSNNKFYGPIPARVNELWGLNVLNLSMNKFEGWYPHGIRNLNQLKVLDFHSNQLTGDVAMFFSELQNVEYIDLSHNLFSGGLPPSKSNISGLGNTLQHLDLSHNQLTGGFMSSETIILFRNLQVLDLRDNLIAGELPSLHWLSNLKVLRLANNQFSGDVPEELFSNMIPLQELDLSGNRFSGSLKEINSSTLSFLNLSSNALTGSLPSSFGGCLAIDLSRNMISGDISIMQNWAPTLEVLDLSSNTLEGNIPDLGSKFLGLTSLKIQNNSLAGNLPEGWNAFSRLLSVDLSINEFMGPIPPSLFSSQTLMMLNLSGNHLSGSIPLQGRHSNELLSLPSYPPMEMLDLSDNSLSGILSQDIGILGRLTLLRLADNHLSGHIPVELGKLEGLVSLDLSRNGFKGQIPNNLPSNLKEFNVSYNHLSGPIPETLRHFPRESFFPGNELLEMSGGKGLSPGIPGGRVHHSSNSSIRVAIIVATIGAAFMIAFVLLAYYRAQLHAFHGKSRFSNEPVPSSGRDVKVGRFNRPSLFKYHKGTATSQTSLSFSNDHLLTSTSRSLSGQAEYMTEIVEHVSEGRPSAASAKSNPQDNASLTASVTKSSPGSPIASPRFFEGSDQPVTLDVYSPDRFVGELFFLDSSLSFTAEELSRAPAEVLGRSSHGTLYKATLESGQMLAVKWLRVGLVRNKKEFSKEVKKIGSIRHPNIVPVRAYYWGPKEQERLILSDFISGDSLALHLYETTPRRYPLLSVSRRVRVALEVARSLLFLHDRGMPHGNLKPTNILLAEPDLSCHLTDYSLHRLMMPVGILEQILNLRALGYCAPELASLPNNKPTPSLKADVYSFGVILMELVTRRSAGDIISGQSGAVDLTDWVRLCDQEGRRRDCIDRDLAGGEEPSKEMEDLLQVSLRCILPVNERPNIRQIYEDLCSIAA